MALPTITFNSSTGSDTAASGAGPSTAVFGAAGAHTNGAASTTIQLPASTDLSQVLSDGSHVLWLNTPSGRQFSKITGVNDGADTVTVEDSFNITLVGAVDWAIGGKRATLDNADSRTLFVVTDGAKPGWTIQLETNQTVTVTGLDCSAAGSNTAGLIRFLGGTGGSHITINQTANAPVLTGTLAAWYIKGIKFTNSNGSKGSARGYTDAGTMTQAIFEDCIFGDATNRLNTAFSITSAPELMFLNCASLHCTSNGFGSAGASSILKFFNCVAHDNDADGWQAAAGEAYFIINSMAYDNAGNGIDGQTTIYVYGFTAHANGGEGIKIANTSNSIVLGCNLTANGAFGLTVSVANGDAILYSDYNNVGAGATQNTSGGYSGVSAGAHDLAVDPEYADAANGDFEPLAEEVLGAGYPSSAFTMGAGESESTTQVDVGAVQAEPAGVAVTAGAIIRRRRRR